MLAVSGTHLTTLLEFHDVMANLPTGLNLDRIDRSQHLAPRLPDQSLKRSDQALKLLML